MLSYRFDEVDAALGACPHASHQNLLMDTLFTGSIMLIQNGQWTHLAVAYTHLFLSQAALA